jgi:site-specific DNA recombinase
MRPRPRSSAAFSTDYVNGRVPRAIAANLNRENVPPRRQKWNASTINGNGTCGTGIVFNALYAGRIA